MRSKVAYIGVFAALAIIFGYVELLIPLSIGVPGVKLGIANIVTIIVLYKMSVKEAVVVSIVRIIITGFLFTNMFSIIYSLSGAFLSIFVMYVTKKSGKFSIFGISMAGGVAHNMGQLLMAMIVMETMSIWYYMPVLLVSGMVTGLLIGFVANEMLERLGAIKMTE